MANLVSHKDSFCKTNAVSINSRWTKSLKSSPKQSPVPTNKTKNSIAFFVVERGLPSFFAIKDLCYNPLSPTKNANFAGFAGPGGCQSQQMLLGKHRGRWRFPMELDRDQNELLLSNGKNLVVLYTQLYGNFLKNTWATFENFGTSILFFWFLHYAAIQKRIFLILQKTQVCIFNDSSWSLGLTCTSLPRPSTLAATPSRNYVVGVERKCKRW